MYDVRWHIQNIRYKRNIRYARQVRHWRYIVIRNFVYCYGSFCIFLSDRWSDGRDGIFFMWRYFFACDGIFFMWRYFRLDSMAWYCCFHVAFKWQWVFHPRGRGAWRYFFFVTVFFANNHNTLVPKIMSRGGFMTVFLKIMSGDVTVFLGRRYFAKWRYFWYQMTVNK